MRIIALAVRAAILPLFVTGCNKPAVLAAGTVAVNVQVTCPDNAVQVSISPYIVSVPEDAELQWILEKSPDVTEFEIDTKQGRPDWPFKDRPPYRGNAKNPPKVRGINNGQVGKKYSYNITATCTPTGKEEKND